MVIVAGGGGVPGGVGTFVSRLWDLVFHHEKACDAGELLMERLCCSVVFTVVLLRKCKFIFYHKNKVNLCKLIYVFSLIYSEVSPPCGCDQCNWYLNVNF